MTINTNRHQARVVVFVLLIIIVTGIISRRACSDFFKPSSLAARPSPEDVGSDRGHKKGDPKANARIGQSYGKLPMLFEANRDQTDPRVKFIARGSGYSMFLTDNEAVMRLRIDDCGSRIADRGFMNSVEQESASSFRDPQSSILNPQSSILNPQSSILNAHSAILRMKLVGANRKPRVSGAEELQTTSNYFVGNDPDKWRTNVANFAKVKYEAVYPGVDLVWYGDQRQLEHDFIVAPGADPKRIKLSFAGADAMTIDGEGAVMLRFGDDAARLLKPVAWQEENGERREVACRYEINRSRQVEFRLGDYDRNRTLVIDPVLAYSTYIGGSGVDQAVDIAVDNDGFAYITGHTDSADFPGPNPIQSAKGAQTD